MAIDDLISMVPQASPKPVEDLAAVEETSTRLSIFGRTRNLRRLEDMPALEALWIDEVNERQLQEILPRIDLLYLHVHGMRVADLRPMEGLSRLQGLEIHRNARVADLSFLEGLTHLRLLALVGCSKVRELGPVSALTDLEILDLAGGMWGTLSLPTLEPIRQLRKLRGLSLKSIRVADESLEPLAGLTRLEQLELSNQFPTEEFARLSAAFPHLACPQLAPYVEITWHDGGTRAMVVGKRKPILELPKDQAKLDRYMRRFEELRKSFRGEE
jgi:hypothetical protein